MEAIYIPTVEDAMTAIAPDPCVETQVFAHFAPHLFMQGKAIEVGGCKHRVAIRPGNVKIVEADDKEYAADGFIEVDGDKVGVIDPERKTHWSGGEWPSNWAVNIAVHPRKQFDLGVFYKNSRTNKLRYMQQCAKLGFPGWIALYSNAFGDPDKPCTSPKAAAIKSALLVPASAIYGPDGSELLTVENQTNRYGADLPVFRPPLSQCVLVSSPADFERVVLSPVVDLIRSFKHEG
jgi:hypothetical protein